MASSSALARSPMACTATDSPALSAPRMFLRSVSSGVTNTPGLSGSFRYGPRRPHGLGELVARRGGDLPINEVHGVVAEQAGRLLAVGLAVDDAAGRVGRVGADPGHLQRLAVGDGHVTVVTAQEDGPVADV